MLLRKKGFPENDEIVLCKVLRIQSNSVFVNLEEYGLKGMLYISEIAPGRIRNIYDYVKPDKIIVCKVIRVNKEKQHIDVSIRRVNKKQRREKIDEIKKEQKAEKIIELLAKKLNVETKDLYNKITSKIFQNYDMIHYFFEDVANDEVDFNKYIDDFELKQELYDLIKQRFKPKQISIKEILNLSVYESDGIRIIHKLFSEINKRSDEETQIQTKYLGGGKYEIKFIAKDYKIAEKKKENIDKILTRYLSKHDCDFELNRIKS